VATREERAAAGEWAGDGCGGWRRQQRVERCGVQAKMWARVGAAVRAYTYSANLQHPDSGHRKLTVTYVSPYWLLYVTDDLRQPRPDHHKLTYSTTAGLRAGPHKLFWVL
jgi:hypothetical protein